MSLATVDPKNIIPLKNGLLDITNIGGELELYEHTPEWFNLWCLPYAFDPDAECPRWQQFLADVLEDADRVFLLQQWFGLCLTPDTSYQKLLLMVGPKRAGKGTVTRLLISMLGDDAVVCPTFASLAGEFGLSQLLDKSLAVFPDAHLSRRTDATRVLEVIKSIVGEDAVSINRKHRAYLYNVRLRIHFVITVNQLPRFTDVAGALEARTLLLPFEKSFAGREDRHLETALRSELPGILNWSLRGLHQLRQQGSFTIPAKARELQDSYRRLTAPVVGFLEDCCRVERGRRTATKDVYERWLNWCKACGHEPGSDASFGEQLRTAEPTIVRKRVRNEDGDRGYVYDGLALAPLVCP